MSLHRRMPSAAVCAAAVGIALLAGAPESARAQAADVLTGRVTGPGGNPVEGARVEVMSTTLETTRSVITGGNGRYTVLFPDGGGSYVVRVTYLGLADQVLSVVREGVEEILVTDVAMTLQPIALEGFTVQVRGGTPGQGQAGEQSTELTQAMLARLPLQDMDPATLALLTPGVVSTGADSISGQLGFSVGGMSELLNQVALDGILLGEGGLGVPEEGVRRTQVSTSTFDVSQGGFAGGLVAVTSARGSNRSGGSLSYRFDDDALQMSSAASTNGFRRQNVGGSWGGPLVRNRLFYNVSFQFQDNVNHRFALTADDPLAAQRSGVAADSVARFLGILSSAHGLDAFGKTGAYDQGSQDVRLSGRMDWNVTQGAAGSHTLTSRFNLNRVTQDSTRISALDLSERGGDTERNTNLAAVTVNSRFRTSWTNALTASLSSSWNESLPFTELPEGRVRITSEWADGTSEARTVTFGGNRGMPSEARSRDLQITDDLSFLQPIGSQLHRLKVGGSLQLQRSESRSTDNIFGSYSYASLEDFEANRPDRFERSLSERESTTNRLNAGLFLGDTWRISQPLEVTLGLRWDYSRLEERPAHNPAVEAAFGRRTDVRPAASGFSPRVGFSYRLNRARAASDAPDQPVVARAAGTASTLSGGIGLFAGRAPAQLFSQAYRQTGLGGAEQRLVCIGSAVPIPDWTGYAVDPGSIPDRCADGGMGVPPAFSSRAADVTLLHPDQSLPSSLRADLAYRTQLRGRIPASVRYTYSRGMGLWGFRDLNLDEGRFFTLGNEGRPFFGDPSGISAPTGATTLATSRRVVGFASVYDVVSGLASEAHQVSLQATGVLRQRTTLMANYTLGFARDQGVAGGGAGGFMGGGGGSFAPTAGNPNVHEWGVSGNDRRHTLNLVLSHVFRPDVEVSLMGRVSSGAPFTPMVDRDVNGDGMRNDRAFVFDPAGAADPAVAQAMDRLLATAPARVVACLEGQLGRIADRNSCRNPWSQSLDLRASLRPNLPRLERRLTVSLDATNLLTGLDQLVHGRDNMKGWGEGVRAETTLLQVRGFNPATNAFVYQVNEGFGQARRGANALRAPFALRLSARITLGGQPALTNRGFGAGGGSLAGAARGGMGGFAGRGGGGEMGAMLSGIFGSAEGAAEAMAALRPILGMVMRGESAEGGVVADALIPNPVRSILVLRDSLALSAEQADSLAALADTLDARLAPRREALAPVVDSLSRMVTRSGGGTPEPSVLQTLQTRLRDEVQPHLAAARPETDEVMARVRANLTDAQWERIPDLVRSGRVLVRGGPGRGGAGPAQGGQPGAPGQPGAQGQRPGGGAGPGMGPGAFLAGNFAPAAMLDRFLANPLPVLLELADPLGMSGEQVKQVEGISAALDRSLRTTREELGRRFDGVTGAAALQLFREVQPEIRAARERTAASLQEVRALLTEAQWERVPPQIRSFRAQIGGMGM